MCIRNKGRALIILFCYFCEGCFFLSHVCGKAMDITYPVYLCLVDSTQGLSVVILFKPIFWWLPEMARLSPHLVIGSWHQIFWRRHRLMKTLSLVTIFLWPARSRCRTKQRISRSSGRVRAFDPKAACETCRLYKALRMLNLSYTCRNVL